MQLKLFETELKPLPTYHNNDRRLEKYCVDCGLLLYLESEFDYMVNTSVKMIEHKINFGGRRCLKCNENLEYFIRENYYGS